LAELQAALAPTIDLLAVVLGAGGTIADGVRVVAERGPEPVRPAFSHALRARDGGMVLADALPTLSAVLGRDYHSLTAVLVVGEEGGAPVGQLLERLADEADQARRRALAAGLARLPVTLIVPLVVCQLPAVIVGAVVPLIVLAVRQLRG
jgi:Flp pilus assembly protein TadB